MNASAEAMPFESELAAYQKHFEELRSHEGRFVLIHAGSIFSIDDAIHFFSSYEEAITAGYDQFGAKPFLVKRIETIERIQFLSRLVDVPETVSCC
jgi:hypothetical protein